MDFILDYYLGRLIKSIKSILLQELHQVNSTDVTLILDQRGYFSDEYRESLHLGEGVQYYSLQASA